MLGQYLECFRANFGCMTKKRNDYQNRKKLISEKCFADCPEECDSIDYRAYQSYLGMTASDKWLRIKVT